jgi:hypothetical protein
MDYYPEPALACNPRGMDSLVRRRERERLEEISTFSFNPNFFK